MKARTLIEAADVTIPSYREVRAYELSDNVRLKFYWSLTGPQAGFSKMDRKGYIEGYVDLQDVFGVHQDVKPDGAARMRHTRGKKKDEVYVVKYRDILAALSELGINSYKELMDKWVDLTGEPSTPRWWESLIESAVPAWKRKVEVSYTPHTPIKVAAIEEYVHGLGITLIDKDGDEIYIPVARPFVKPDDFEEVGRGIFVKNRDLLVWLSEQGYDTLDSFDKEFGYTKDDLIRLEEYEAAGAPE